VVTYLYFTIHSTATCSHSSRCCVCIWRKKKNNYTFIRGNYFIAF